VHIWCLAEALPWRTMFIRRRAYFSSASCLHRRACDEPTARTGLRLACHRMLLSSFTLQTVCSHTLIVGSTLRKSSSYLPVPLPKAMDNTAPLRTSPTSPTASCRWKRGRPVFVPYSTTTSSRGKGSPAQQSHLPSWQSLPAVQDLSLRDQTRH
jgi:hypothetical protein